MKLDPRLILEDGPAVPEPIRVRKLAPLRSVNHAPRRALAAGFRRRGPVALLAEAEPRRRGVVAAFAVDGRKVYVRWEGDLGAYSWHWLADLEPLS